MWYGVPAHASKALEEAVQDALPHLFETAPNLLYQLVTMVSPKQLLARGVPVHRLVHEEGSFVITFPNAYHSGFNTGAAGRPSPCVLRFELPFHCPFLCYGSQHEVGNEVLLANTRMQEYTKPACVSILWHPHIAILSI